jgi:hypothetical protein
MKKDEKNFFKKIHHRVSARAPDEKIPKFSGKISGI